MYLDDEKRGILTRWRLSCHKLRIETGRYKRPKIDRERRVCLHCGRLEDESHVVFDCPLFFQTRLKHHKILRTCNNIHLLLNPRCSEAEDVARLLLDTNEIIENR